MVDNAPGKPRSARPAEGTASHAESREVQSEGATPTGDPLPKTSRGERHGDRTGISEKVSGQVEKHFRKSLAGVESGVKIGTVLSGLLGAIGAWWLGGQSLLLAAAGGLVTAWGIPRLLPEMSRVVAPFSKGAGKIGKTNAGTIASTVARTDAPQGVPIAMTDHEMEVSESGLGNLSSLSELLPRAKEPGNKGRL